MILFPHDHHYRPQPWLRRAHAFQGREPKVHPRQLLRHHRCERRGEIDLPENPCRGDRARQGRGFRGQGGAHRRAHAGSLRL